MNSFTLIGKTQTHLRPFSDRFFLHVNVIRPFQELQRKAKKAGFLLDIISGFRSYEQQFAIWQKKLKGERPLWDYSGENKLQASTLSDKELLYAILRWSAFPGLSRHHWGSDIDIYEASSINRLQVELIHKETLPSAPMGPFYCWLDELLKQDKACGFYRPYEEDHGGIAIEKWHISHRKTSKNFEHKFHFKIFCHLLKNDLRWGPKLTKILDEEKENIFNKYFVRLKR